MKAIVLKAYGDSDQIEVQDVPDPKPGAGEVLVRVAAASLNPIDWKQRSGHYHKFMPLEFPAILGKDASGEVVALGSGVTAFKVGAKVLGRANHTHAELVVGPVDGWATVPDGMDVVDAAALPLIALTGAQLAEEALDAQPGQVVLVTGATGSVGRVAVFAAKARGATVWAGVRGAYKVEAATLGADHVVALDDDRALASLPVLDGLADTVGGEITQKIIPKIKPGGRIGSVLGDPPGAKERGLVVRSIVTHADSKRLGELARAVAAGQLIIPIAKRFSFADAAAAYALAEKGANGKVLLTP